MARPLKGRRLPAPRKKVPKKLQSVTPLIYYGGKSRDVDWIIREFPPHDCFVDVFGGGGAVTFAKVPTRVDVYNDLGNVSNFMRVLRDFPDALYDRLYFSNFSRQLFYDCRERWQEISQYYQAVVQSSGKPFREVFDLDSEMALDWAFCWYVTVLQGHSHEEIGVSWKVSKGNDTAMSVNNKVDELYRFAERLRGVVIECRDFQDVIKLYDAPGTLFYCDPPYTPGSRASSNNYIHEMSIQQHQKLLHMLNGIAGQAVVSMYSDDLYNSMLTAPHGWRRKTVSHVSAIHQYNAGATDGRGSRTEVLWVKEHRHGLWEDENVWKNTSPDVPPISGGMEN